MDETTEKILSSLVVDAIARIKEHIRLNTVSFLKAGQGESIATYSHNNGQIFAAFTYKKTNEDNINNETINTLLKDIALQIAANAPLYVSRESVDESYINEKMKEFKKEFEESGKPMKLADKILEGKLTKHLKNLCLMDQPFIKDSAKSVKLYIDEILAEFDCSIQISNLLYQSVKE
jgi:elongation factor Ts